MLGQCLLSIIVMSEWVDQDCHCLMNYVLIIIIKVNMNVPPSRVVNPEASASSPAIA